MSFTQSVSDDMSGLDNSENNGERHEVTVGSTRDPHVTDQLDVIFDVLRDSRRRYLLYHLHDVGESIVTFEEAVEAVCSYQRAATGVDGVSRQQVRIDLIHAQFPRLEDAGVLEYDPRRAELYVLDERPLGEWVTRARDWELD